MNEVTVCKICGHASVPVFQSRILGKHDVVYFHCPTCGFLQTEEPHWLQSAYQHTINKSDTGYMERNLALVKKVSVLLRLCFDSSGRFVDYGGGYGVFVRLMRDVGFDFFWTDAHTPNLLARGFEWETGQSQTAEAVTAFECFEHFTHPLVEIERMLSISRNLIFTTELLPDPLPGQGEWWYYGTEHGQHISFYRERTLRKIADRFSLKYARAGALHILTDRASATGLRLKLLRLSKLGLHRLLTAPLKSRSRADHFRFSQESNTP